MTIDELMIELDVTIDYNQSLINLLESYHMAILSIPDDYYIRGFYLDSQNNKSYWKSAGHDVWSKSYVYDSGIWVIYSDQQFNGTMLYRSLYRGKRMSKLMKYIEHLL